MLLTFFKRLTIILLFTNCTVNYGQLKLVGNLPSDLQEVSGVETIPNSDKFWMVNDGGNHPRMYVVNATGKIEKTLQIEGKNEDWEDLTKDKAGNVYIGDFGNNNNRRKDLKIYILAANDLNHGKNILPSTIEFSFPNQKKFPPKKKDRYFDVESFFHLNGYLYLFTKSRVKKDYGRTNLYKIPAKSGKHEAEFISTFNSCEDFDCAITSAAISPNGKKVVLLSHETILQFTNFKDDDFLGGKMTKFDLDHKSQKEGICFKDNNTVYITDERSRGKGRNLYVFTLD
ncbi:hypothetical protein IMCC3317_24440 [Kordia antarctica]|uniref:Uncharacterized protein n=1 Tax=Kordia antarctica TaxID=1218801 RepID=A0A7L4ZLK3_9FLAO|nr:hypothetical protein [Kordia antarctica]QHI37066.1 hypothetical protein IMCC3317_24440 [Kordia antarctica]